MVTRETPGIEINVSAEQDDTPVRGNAMASGDDTADREAEDEILERLDRGFVWAWAVVRVSVSYRGIIATDTLGACSYQGEREFRADGHFTDMVDTCIDQINAELLRRAPIRINLTDMHWQPETSGFTQTDRDMAIRKVAAEVGASTNYGARHEYTTCGDHLALAVRSADGTTRVYDCRVVRSATFTADGKQLK